jgi:hypothetical protein
MRTGRVKGPTLLSLVIPIGMIGGALLGLLLGFYTLPAGEPSAASRPPGDPNDGPAMLGVFLMFAGAAAGTLIGIVAALVLYLKKRRQAKFG